MRTTAESEKSEAMNRVRDIDAQADECARRAMEHAKEAERLFRMAVELRVIAAYAEAEALSPVCNCKVRG